MGFDGLFDLSPSNVTFHYTGFVLTDAGGRIADNV